VRKLIYALFAAALMLAACGSDTGAVPNTTGPSAPATIGTSDTTPTTRTVASSIAPAPTTTGTVPSSVTAVTEVPPILVSTADGVDLWTGAAQQALVEGTPSRVSFRFADGTLVYQESNNYYIDASPVMILRPGADPEMLVEPNGVSPILWGVGEIEGHPVLVYERWPLPCGLDDSLAVCEGRLMALDLLDSTERDLGAFSAPGYALGPSEVENGIVLNYNSGAEIGELGTFWLRDLDGNHIDNPVCARAVECSLPIRMFGALSPGAATLAYVLDRTEVGTETEYEVVDRTYGIVEYETGRVILSVELDTEGTLAWLDFNGRYGLVSVSQSDGLITYLISEDGTVNTLNLGGTATFPDHSVSRS
jgi:hypothetical protein